MMYGWDDIPRQNRGYDMNFKTVLFITYILATITRVASVDLGQSCTSNLQCDVTNSSCQSGVCKCITGTIDDNGSNVGGSCRSESDFVPQNVHVDDIGIHHLRTSWTDPVAVNFVSYFVVTHTIVKTGHTVSQNVTKTYTTSSVGCNINQQVFSALLNGLNEGTNYKVNIESITNGGIIGTELFQYTKPSKPDNITSTNIAPTVTVTWTHDTLASVTYSVVVKSNNSILLNVTSVAKTKTVSGLQPGETYAISVYAVAMGIYSDPTAMTLVTSAIPPDPPKELRYDRRSSTQAILHWLQPDNKYGTVDYYWIHVELEKVLTGAVIKTTFQATSWTFNGINTTKDYCFMVYSHNVGGFNSTYPSTVCLIDSEPPVITYCPKQMTAYADKTSLSARVTWLIPTATDNSMKPVKITQTSGQPPSSDFSIGVHYISYQAEDEVGNIEPNCYFYVIVKAIFCEAPVLKDKYIKFTCPSGYQYGFSCTLSCIGGFDLLGPSSMVCDSSNASSPVNNTVWNFQPQLQEPACNATEAPFFTYCPDTTMSSAAKGTNSTVVSWLQPNATDYFNREVIIEQIMGQQSGSSFNTGVHEVKYRASSPVLTKSTDCSFFVFVIKDTSTISTDGSNTSSPSVGGYIAGIAVLSVIVVLLIIVVIVLCGKLKRVIMEMKKLQKSNSSNESTNFTNMDTEMPLQNPDNFNYPQREQDSEETNVKSVSTLGSSNLQPQNDHHNYDGSTINTESSYLQPFSLRPNSIPSAAIAGTKYSQPNHGRRNNNGPTSDDGSTYLHPQNMLQNQNIPSMDPRRQFNVDVGLRHRLPGDGGEATDQNFLQGFRSQHLSPGNNSVDNCEEDTSRTSIINSSSLGNESAYISVNQPNDPSGTTSACDIRNGNDHYQTLSEVTDQHAYDGLRRT